MNAQPNLPKLDKRVGVTHDNYFKIGMIFQINKDWFTTNRPTPEEAVAHLSKLAGIPVSISTLKKLKKTIGVKWIAHRSDNGKSHKEKWVSTKFKDEFHGYLTDLVNIVLAIEDIRKQLGLAPSWYTTEIRTRRGFDEQVKG